MLGMGQLRVSGGGGPSPRTVVLFSAFRILFAAFIVQSVLDRDSGGVVWRGGQPL